MRTRPRVAITTDTGEERTMTEEPHRRTTTGQEEEEEKQDGRLDFGRNRRRKFKLTILHNY